MTNEEYVAQLVGQTTEQAPGLEGIAMNLLPKDVSSGDRLKQYQRVSQGLYPVKSQEEYMKEAQRLYPKESYQKEKFWSDIMLGLGMLTGRSEQGQFFPILEQNLGKWLEARDPIFEAQRQREAQMQ